MTPPPVIMYAPDGRPIIRIYAGRNPEIADACLDVLAKAEPVIFASPLGLVTVLHGVESKNAAVNRPNGALTLHVVDGTHFCEIMGRMARFEKWDSRAKEWVPCDCPRRVADTVLARGQWPEPRYLAGFIEAPTITPSGRIIDEPGHDLETSLFLKFSRIDGYTTPPKNPSHDDAAKALEFLLEMTGEFPYVEPCDRAAAVSGILSVLVCRLLPSTPMFGITAPTPGTGKTTWGETYSVIGTARRSSVISLGHDEAETEKRIDGLLTAGDIVGMLDNITRPVGDDVLCQIISQPSRLTRLLGSSTMVRLSTNFMLVATGNNLSFVKDMPRRVVLCRMDANIERPELREFDDDHLAKVLRERGRIITASLTIIKAYLSAHTPKVEGLAPYGSFEEWDRMVRRPLCWLGLPDPLIASESLRGQDPDIEAMRLLYSSWREVFTNHAVPVADVVKMGMTLGINGDHTYPDLYAALQLICSEKVNSRRAGYWLRSHRNRIVDGMRLEQVGTDRLGIAKWLIAS